MSSASSADQGAQKLAVVFRPLLDETTKTINERTVASSQEVLLAIGRIEARLDVLEKLMSEKRKPVAARSEKKTAGGDAPVETPAPVQKNFAVNKLVYFRDHFKNDADYRAKYVTPELQELMKKDPTITGKVKEDQKLVAQATFCWNYFKNNKPDVAEAIEKEYVAAKQAYEASTKPPQQTAEAHTPGAKA